MNKLIVKKSLCLLLISCLTLNCAFVDVKKIKAASIGAVAGFTVAELLVDLALTAGTLIFAREVIKGDSYREDVTNAVNDYLSNEEKYSALEKEQTDISKNFGYKNIVQFPGGKLPESFDGNFLGLACTEQIGKAIEEIFTSNTFLDTEKINDIVLNSSKLLPTINLLTRNLYICDDFNVIENSETYKYIFNNTSSNYQEIMNNYDLFGYVDYGDIFDILFKKNEPNYIPFFYAYQSNSNNNHIGNKYYDYSDIYPDPYYDYIEKKYTYTAGYEPAFNNKKYNNGYVYHCRFNRITNTIYWFYANSDLNNSYYLYSDAVNSRCKLYLSSKYDYMFFHENGTSKDDVAFFDSKKSEFLNIGENNAYLHLSNKTPGTPSTSSINITNKNYVDSGKGNIKSTYKERVKSASQAFKPRISKKTQTDNEDDKEDDNSVIEIPQHEITFFPTYDLNELPDQTILTTPFYDYDSLNDYNSEIDSLEDSDYNRENLADILNNNATNNMSSVVTDGQPVPVPDNAEDSSNSDDTKEDEKSNINTELPLMPRNSLSDIFPFCLPFDLYNVLNLFVAEPEVPKFEMPVFILNGKGNLKKDFITIDLSSFDSVAILVRSLLVIVFSVALIGVTSNIMGGGRS